MFSFWSKDIGIYPHTLCIEFHNVISPALHNVMLAHQVSNHDEASPIPVTSLHQRFDYVMTNEKFIYRLIAPVEPPAFIFPASLLDTLLFLFSPFIAQMTT